MGVHVWDTCENIKNRGRRRRRNRKERRRWREHWQDTAAGLVQGRGWGSARVKDRQSEEGELDGEVVNVEQDRSWWRIGLCVLEGGEINKRGSGRKEESCRVL